MIHALLERDYQVEAEERMDESMLQPGDVVPSQPHPPWWEYPELVGHVDGYPLLGALLGQKATPLGWKTLIAWAEVPPVEEDAYDLHLIGWTDEVIAAQLTERFRRAYEPEMRASTAREYYARAEARIRAVLTQPLSLAS